MRSNVAKTAQSNPLHSMDLRVAKASIDVHRSETSDPIAGEAFDLSLVVQAIAAAGMQDKEFCLCGGLDQSQWSRIKAGIGNLQAKVLLCQPAKFWIALDRLQRQKLGISQETEEQIRSGHAKAVANEIWLALGECFKKDIDR